MESQQFIGRGFQQREIIKREHGLYLGKLFLIDFIPNTLVGKKKLRVGMIHDKPHALFIKFVQDAYRYCPIRKGCEESDRPPGRVFTTQGHLIATFYPGVLKIVVQPVDLPRYIFVIIGDSLKVSHGRHLPMVTDALFYQA